MAGIREKVEKLVMASLTDILAEFESDPNVTPKTRIYGGDSPLDSMAVVSMIVDLEGRLGEELNFHVSISDERAMSQKHSPFRDVDSMVKYLLILYEESQSD